MNWMLIAGFSGYATVTLALAAIGIVYLCSDRIMPYHLKAMGVETWEQLAHGPQVMTLNFMKSAGTGFVSCSLSIFILLIVPYRAGEIWAVWAIAGIALSQLGLILLRMRDIIGRTDARPPVWPMVSICAVVVVSLILSLASMH